MTRSEGFPPVARADATILILGSLPGQRSINAGEYYAHPQNAFWKIMRNLYAVDGNYEERCAALLEHRIALWDVLSSSIRPGSLDANIRTETANANDFGQFFSTHPEIHLIAFNGQKAQQMFRKFVHLDDVQQNVETKALPSSSPAHAAMSWADKAGAWKTALTVAPD